MTQKYDVSIVGGGIIGLSAAYKLQLTYPKLNLIIVEKEKCLASHQTGSNSGVIHSGLYYKPGSLRAKNCVDGRKQLVDFAKNTNSILGDGRKIIQPSEYVVINSQRKSIYAVKDIKAREKLSRHNICIKGPGGGILPKYYELLLTRKAKNNISQDHPIKWDDI